MILPLLSLLAAQSKNLPVTATVSFPKSAYPGGTVRAAVKLHFAQGLHGYQNPPSDEYEIPVTVKLVSGAKMVSISYPKGTKMAMGNTPPVKVYSGDVTVNVVLKAPNKSGPIVFKVNYQQCTDSSCFPPASVTVKSTLSVAR